MSGVNLDKLKELLEEPNNGILYIKKGGIKVTAFDLSDESNHTHESGELRFSGYNEGKPYIQEGSNMMTACEESFLVYGENDKRFVEKSIFHKTYENFKDNSWVSKALPRIVYYLREGLTLNRKSFEYTSSAKKHTFPENYSNAPRFSSEKQCTDTFKLEDENTENITISIQTLEGPAYINNEEISNILKNDTTNTEKVVIRSLTGELYITTTEYVNNNLVKYEDGEDINTQKFMS